MFGCNTVSKKTTVFVLIFLLFFGLGVFSQEPEAAAEPGEEVAAPDEDDADRISSAMERFAASSGDEAVDAPGGLGTFIETVVILALFVLGIYGVFRFVQKKRGTTVSGVETIRILSSLSVGGNRMLQLVGVGDQVFFIGVADNAINKISEITDKETIDWIRMVYSRGEVSGSEGFVEKLFSLLGKDSKSSMGQRTERKVDFLEEQKRRLSKMHDE